MKKFIKAEMWDKMQYLFRHYYDRMIHLAFYFKGELNVEAFKNAVNDMFNQVPILHSSYKNNFIKPYWVIKPYSINDVVFVEENCDYESALNNFLCNTISVKSNVQMKIAIIKSNASFTIGILFNHMCMDGGDGKKLIATLFENYNNIINGENLKAYRQGRRDFAQVYDGFDLNDKKAAKSLYRNISAVKEKNKFPFSPCDGSEKITINKIYIEPEIFLKLKQKGKQNGISLNDLFLCAYISSLYKMGIDNGSSVTIPCMVDLRRHIPNQGEQNGYCNHTGFMQCTVPHNGKDFDELLTYVKDSTSISKQDKFLGLYSLPLLNLGYTIFPHFISEMAIRIGYQNPLKGMSNVGELKSSIYTLKNSILEDCFITGAVKYKPYMQLALSTYNNKVTMTIAIKGNEKDNLIAKEFLATIKDTINDYVK